MEKLNVQTVKLKNAFVLFDIRMYELGRSVKAFNHAASQMKIGFWTRLRWRIGL